MSKNKQLALIATLALALPVANRVLTKVYVWVGCKGDISDILAAIATFFALFGLAGKAICLIDKKD